MDNVVNKEAVKKLFELCIINNFARSSVCTDSFASVDIYNIYSEGIRELNMSPTINGDSVEAEKVLREIEAFKSSFSDTEWVKVLEQGMELLHNRHGINRFLCKKDYTWDEAFDNVVGRLRKEHSC